MPVSETSQLVDTIAFRGAMGAVASPVSVVTSYDGAPHGTTVSAFASLSLEPPMVLVSMQNDSELLPVIKRTERFGLNVLAATQDSIGARFARRGLDRFAGVEWELHGAVPRLVGTAAWAACRIESLIVCGDHTIVTGLVEFADHRPVTGLVYQHRQFGVFTPTQPATV